MNKMTKRKHKIANNMNKTSFAQMTKYALCNFGLLLFAFIIVISAVLGAVYIDIESRIDEKLRDVTETFVVEGFDNFNHKEFASDIKYYPYDKDGKLYQYSSFRPQLAPIDKKYINSAEDINIDKEIINSLKNLINTSPSSGNWVNFLDNEHTGYKFRIDTNNEFDSYYAFAVKYEYSTWCQYMVFMVPINDLLMFRSALTCMLPYLVPCIFLLIIGLSFIMSYYQSRPSMTAIRAANNFTSNVSHEFNTPLSIVYANLQNVLDDPEATVGESSSQLYVAMREVDRLKRMVGQLLVLSRADNNRLPINKMHCDLTKLVQVISEPYQLMAETDDKAFSLQLNCRPTVRIDKDLFIQVMTALLDNALKYTKAGDTIALSVTTTMTEIVLEVADTGIGVNEKELTKIFNRFYRGEESRSTEGSGLGLSIVQSIVQSLNGNIEARRNTPCGLIMTVKVPI